MSNRTPRAGSPARSPASASRPRRDKPPASPRGVKASESPPPVKGGTAAETAALHLRALGRLIPRLRAEPAELSKCAAGLISWTGTEHADLRWLCEALAECRDTQGGLPPPSPMPPPPSLPPPSPLLALPSPLLLRVLRPLPVVALGAAACSCRGLRDASYGGSLEAWGGGGGGTLVLECKAHEVDDALVDSLRRRGVTSVAVGAAAIDLSDAQARALLGACVGLERLQLEGCDCLTDAVAPTLGAARLRELSLAGCDGLGADALAELLRAAAPRLTALDLSFLDAADAALHALLAPALRPGGELAAAGGGLLSALDALSLCSCATLSDETCAALALHAAALRALNLSGCLRLSDLAVGLLLAKLPRLTSADLSYLCVSDAGALHALCALPGLTSLNLEGCPLCSEAGLQQLAAALPKLRLANFSGCDVDPGRGDFTAVVHGEGGEVRGVLTPRDTPQFLMTPRGAGGGGVTARSRFIVATEGI